jgi:dihydrofolate reductase
MARLVYTGITSLDGYISDADGDFDWSAPDEEVHAFVNDLERPVGTYLYGRRLYETMVAWETMDDSPDEPEVVRDYTRLWRAADKVVFSSTLEAVSSERTRIERVFDPLMIAALVASSPTDVSIGGAHLAAAALRAGIVDTLRVFVNPVIVGGGTRFLPDDVRLELELVDEHRFANGVVYCSYDRKHVE